MLPVPVVALPRGRQFALTWGIPNDFGGMTSALLHRSRAFVRLGGSPVDVLTFDARPDYPEVEAGLRARGELIDGMRLLNLWDWLRTHEVHRDDAGPLDLGKHPPTPLDADPAYVVQRRGTTELSRTRYAADGVTVLQADHYREDGTLLASDRRDVRVFGELSGRSVVLCDAAGAPLVSWGAIWPLYRFWLDLLRDREPSFLIVDSKTVANFAMTYRRKRAVLVHVVHNSHLAGEQRPIAPLRESRRAVFENLAAFDAVVVLTERQRKDVEELLGPVPNVVTVPNGRDLSGNGAPGDRPPGRGVVLASLTSRKRVDHAVRAAISAARHVPVTLDVFGDGEHRAAIEAIASGSPVVRLHGYRSDARQQLDAASFILLTGRTEGFPLVLVEAMAAGCIPIAYDVAYGPADMIVHGKNGFLVAPGDEAGLAEAIVALQRMPWTRVSRMRRSARRSAAAFSDLEVTKRWAAQLRAADARKASGWGRITA